MMTILPLPFQFAVLFISSCRITVPRISNTMLNRSGESVQSSVFPDSTRKTFSFSPLSRWVCHKNLSCWDMFPQYSFLVRVFFLSWMDAEFYQMLFLHLLRWSCGFCLFFCWCGVSYRFVFVEPFLWPGDESSLGSWYMTFLYVIGFSLLIILLRFLCVYIYHRYWPVIFFFGSVFAFGIWLMVAS